MPLEIQTKDKKCIFRPEFLQLLQKKNFFGCYPKHKHVEMMRDAVKNGRIERILDNTYGVNVPLEAKLCRIWLKFGNIIIHIIALEYPEVVHPKDAFRGS